MRNLLVIVLLLGGSAVAEEAEVTEATQETRLREAVQRALPPLAEAGQTWIEQRKCISCHHVSFLVWTHQAAHERGLEVDREQLQEWTDFLLSKSLDSHAWHQLTPEAFAALKDAGLPEAVSQKLQVLQGRSFVDAVRLQEALAATLTAEELAAWLGPLTEKSAAPRQFGKNDGGSMSMLGGLALTGLIQQDHPLAKGLREVTGPSILRWQEADARWQAEGQFLVQQRTADEAHLSTTCWTLLALQSLPPTEAVTAAIQRGLAIVERDVPKLTESNELVLVRYLLAERRQAIDEAAKLRGEIILRQQADGGWSWKVGAASDTYTTGLTLYALQTGTAADRAAEQKAVEFLLRTQQPDGTWPSSTTSISTRKTEELIRRGDKIYGYWGDAWATLGLLSVLPPIGTSPAAAPAP